MRRGETRGPALTLAPAEGEDQDAREDTCACRAGPEASSPGVPQSPQLRPSPLRTRLRLAAASRPAAQPPSRAKPVSIPYLVPQAGRTLPAARPPRPIPTPASPHASLESTHGDPGPRAAAAEGTSGPGRPAGAERQAKGRGPRRAGEVAHHTPQRAVSGTPGRSAHAQAKTPRSGVLFRPTAVRAVPGRVPTPGC